jgi:hypothetical protein
MKTGESPLALQEQSFRDGLAKIAEKDRRRQRAATLLTSAMAFAAACWLAVSALGVHRLNRTADQLRTSNEQLQSEIDRNKQIVIALNPLLREFGWAGDKLPKDSGNIARITRSVQADDKISTLRLSEHPPRAWNETVQYFPKDVDGNKVRSALADFGFRVEERPPLVPDVPANDIVFGDRIPPENAKLVSYVLIRAGIDIRGIHRSRLAPKSDVIQVIGNRIVADGAPLSVDSIEKQSTFDLDPD